MDLDGYLRAVRKGWWIVVLATVLCAAAGAAYVLTSTPVYQAHITFYVRTSSSNSASPESTALYLQDSATSYASLASSERLARLVRKTAQVDLPTSVIASRISGAAELNTVLFAVTVEDTVPDRALAIAAAVGKDFPIMVSDLNQSSGSNGLELDVVSGPTVGSSPVSPRVKIDIAAAIAAGLLIGVLLAILREIFDTAIRSAGQLVELTGRPSLGQITFDSAARSAPLFIDEDDGMRRSEEFRQLRTNISFLDAVGPTRVVVVTSSVETEGKSTTAANLAVVAAQSGSRVLLIEADLRHPSVSAYLGLERASGLTNVLAGQVELADVLQSWGGDRLSVLASGPTPPNPSELLGGIRMEQLLVDARRFFDLVVIDTPPLLPVTDAAVVARQSDGVLLVVRHGRTRRGQVDQAVGTLDTIDVPLLGTVLNMRPVRGVDASSYHGSSYYFGATDATSAAMADATAFPAVDVRADLRAAASARTGHEQPWLGSSAVAAAIGADPGRSYNGRPSRQLEWSALPDGVARRSSGRRHRIVPLAPAETPDTAADPAESAEKELDPLRING